MQKSQNFMLLLCDFLRGVGQCVIIYVTVGVV